MAEKVKPVPLADIIAERIQTMILEGALRPGEKLLGERELAERLGVSRPSLHQALAQLEERGLLVSGKSGTSVARFLDRLADPLAELFVTEPRATADYIEFRRTVEVAAAGYAAIRATQPEREAIADCLRRIQAAHDAGESALEADVDAELHGLIYEASHNLMVLHIMRVLGDLLRKNVFYNRETLYLRAGLRDLLLAQHLRIGEAVLSGDANEAGEAMRAHMDFTGSTLEDIQREEARLATAMRRIDRKYLVAGAEDGQG
ncbi:MULTISPECIES: FCD domain-containing protein [Acidocella]|uniref:FCD domain-containing protein n=1 Tax=Acidocella TaxID=50709 RepID=UPI00028C6EF6|nr:MULTISPECIES: FCD domain-containing protein [Acidocella]EKM99011.1 GntR family transcriptional regulator [Acidocella sp. MX-AZ02]WBO58607.1 FCD domain-containing protein [Acidocella sp. MX-AZ03]